MVTICISDLSGRTIKTINKGFGDGNQYIDWDGRADDGNPVGQGLYLCILQTPVAKYYLKIVVIRE